MVTEEVLEEEDAEVNALLQALPEGIFLIQEIQIKKIGLLSGIVRLYNVELGDRRYVLKEGPVRGPYCLPPSVSCKATNNHIFDALSSNIHGKSLRQGDMFVLQSSCLDPSHSEARIYAARSSDDSEERDIAEHIIQEPFELQQEIRICCTFTTFPES